MDRGLLLILGEVHPAPHRRGHGGDAFHGNIAVIFIDVREVLLDDGGVTGIQDHVGVADLHRELSVGDIDHLFGMMADRNLGILCMRRDLKLNQHRLRGIGR